MTIFEAVENGDLNTLKRLVNNKKEENDDVVDYINSQNPITGISLLHIAAKHGFLDICQYLQQLFSLIYITDLKGRTPLHYCAKGSHQDICKFLIDNKAFIDAKDIFFFFLIEFIFYILILFNFTFYDSFLIKFHFIF